MCEIFFWKSQIWVLWLLFLWYSFQTMNIHVSREKKPFCFDEELSWLLTFHPRFPVKTQWARFLSKKYWVYLFLGCPARSILWSQKHSSTDSVKVTLEYGKRAKRPLSCLVSFWTLVPLETEQVDKKIEGIRASLLVSRSELAETFFLLSLSLSGKKHLAVVPWYTSDMGLEIVRGKEGKLSLCNLRHFFSNMKPREIKLAWFSKIDFPQFLLATPTVL